MNRSLLCIVIALTGLGCASQGNVLYDFDDDGSLDADDCAPSDPLIHPGADDPYGDGIDQDCDGNDGVDADGDGYASAASGGEDCNDGDAAVYPGAEEIYDDGIDNDCVGGDASCDGDGDESLGAICGGPDCDDSNSQVNPLASEVCDGLDTNCDGVLPLNEADSDGDLVRECSGDCDDTNAGIGPQHEEACDGLDTNCDGVLGDGIGGRPDELDVDADGVSACAGDCDDGDELRTPGAEELCDGLDTNCDGVLGDGTAGTPDEGDLDGDGDPACSDCDDNDHQLETLDLDGDLVTTCAGDCNDDPSTDPNAAVIYPAALDSPFDGVDANCDGIPGVDADQDGWALGIECDDTDASLNFNDVDADGYVSCPIYDGPTNVAILGGDDCNDTTAAVNPADLDNDGVTTCGPDGIDATGDEDCDDDDPANFPGNTEVCDGLDSDCLAGADFTNGLGDELDLDGDGSLTCLNECDDNDPANFPGNPEICDGQDNDCNPATDETTDFDGDGYAAICDGDCNDFAATAYPGGVEICDLLDNNCDGAVDEGMDIDDDGDGWLECQGDCDDFDASLHPGQWDLQGDGIDADCDGTDGTGLGLSTDYSFVGESSGDGAGHSVSSAGDVDGDGLSDLLVGAYAYDFGARYDAGKTYLVLASSLGSSPVIDLSLADYSFVGENNYDRSGYSVSSAGDVDGDGLSDLLIGAYRNNDGGSQAGKAYLILGSSLGLSPTIDLSLADYSFVGENPSDQAGISVSSAGDVDGDGLSDLLIGAKGNNDGGSQAGKAYLILGSSLGLSPTIDLSLADYSFLGEPYDWAGSSLSSAGDVDGDGRGDLLVGAPSQWGAGKAHLVLGSSLGSVPTIDLSLADYSFVGENNYDRAGSSLSSAGDVDGDGLSDLLVGAWGNDDGAFEAGRAYLILGSSLGSSPVIDLSSADYSFVGENSGDYAGSSVSSAGDVDGDGLDDLLIGAPRQPGSQGSGRSYLILGSSLGSSPVIDLSLADYSFVGENSGDYAGSSVSSAGDVDGDGLSDLLVGAYDNDDGGADAGKAYLLLSTFPTPDYAGLWTLGSTTTYSCLIGAVTANLDHLNITHCPDYAPLDPTLIANAYELSMDPRSPQPGLLQGGFVASASPASFEVTGTESLSAGACTATWALTGSYTGPDTLSADFTATFTGSCGDCTNQSFPVTATR